VVPQEVIAPNAEAIRADLKYMTRRWGELHTACMFEVRAFKENCQPQVVKYAPDWIDGPEGAVQFIVDLNSRGYNIYAVRNPINPTRSGSASDADIVAAFFLWADCDDPAAAGNVLRFDGPKWSASVVTGTTPSTRAHTYWELAEPCTDMVEWRAMQATIAAHFASDPSVINPSRIMRVGGTVSYPDTKKQGRGYINEVTELRTEYADPRAPVTMSQMARVFGEREPAVRQSLSSAATPSRRNTGTFNIDTGSTAAPLDRERLAIQATSGMDWHNAVIRLVASYVGKGLSDDEIHALTQPLTLSGFTGHQTAQEVQTAIDGARRKGWTPEATFTPSFDHAPASPEAAQSMSFDAPPLMPQWRLQSAEEFTRDFVAPEYLIDGVIQRGRLYTLTAPTGSGKTAVMLYISTAMSRGENVCERETEAGDVIYMAGENPDDVRARMIATMEKQNILPQDCRLHFIAGTFNIRKDMDLIHAKIAELPNVTMVVVDTLAAYFDGEDTNSNAMMLDFARVLRTITTAKSKPAVIVPAHPVKNALKSNLTPMGGSALLNEVDGNLCLWKREAAVELHWQGKHRGAEFDPIMFELVGVKSDLVKDSKGRLMPTVMAIPLDTSRAIEIATVSMTMEDRLLVNINAYPQQSVRQRCVEIRLVNDQGFAKVSTMARILKKLREEKLIEDLRGYFELTARGKKALEILLNEGTKVDPDL